MTPPVPPSLHLRSIGGPKSLSFDLPPERGSLAGRAPHCAVVLPDPTVSREHASLARLGGRWFVTDLASRAGTFLNGLRLEPNRPAPLEADDRVGVGPWTFRVGPGRSASESVTTVNDTRTRLPRLLTVGSRDLGALAQRRLEILFECAERLNSAGDAADIARVVLPSAVRGTGFARGALLRSLGSDRKYEVLSRYAAGGREGAFSFSRTLLRKAAAGSIVRLIRPRAADLSRSAAELHIHSALCAPVPVGNSLDTFLYLDARGREARVSPDATEFCQALARLLGFALSNLKRAELEMRQRLLESELEGARDVQRRFFPPPAGAIGGLLYAHHLRPGMVVAGDLFDVVPLGPRRTVVCLGDVTGEGIGAGLLMALAQARFHATLERCPDIAEAIASTNRFLGEHSPSDRFVSLWAGLFDAEDRSVTFVDAGHGHWLRSSMPETCPSDGVRGPVLGVEESPSYAPQRLDLVPGERVVLWSDGIVEQRSAQGEFFGARRVARAIAGAKSPGEDVEGVFESLVAFAGAASLKDDASIASVAFAG